MRATTDRRYATTGTFWGNVCGDGENVMPNPIPPEQAHVHWYLHSTQVVLVDQGERHINLFITWTWAEVR